MTRLVIHLPARRQGKSMLNDAILASRGYQVNWRTGTRCPACDCGSFMLGRASAECVRCGAALPLAAEIEAQGGHQPPSLHDRRVGLVVLLTASIVLWTVIILAGFLIWEII